jgi:hypothetical protein
VVDPSELLQLLHSTSRQDGTGEKKAKWRINVFVSDSDVGRTADKLQCID